MSEEPFPAELVQKACLVFTALMRQTDNDPSDTAWVDAIARALMEERAAERERAKAHWLQWHQKRMGISRAFWLSASKAALDGDLRELRNRVALAEAEPVQLVLSEGQP